MIFIANGAHGEQAARFDFFEAKIRPVLSAECYECHDATKHKGGLRLDYRDGWMKGGDSGPAIVPGDSTKSLLFKAITHEDKELKMPEKGAKLEDQVIADFKTWIEMGAPDPRDTPPIAKNKTEVPWDDKLRARKEWWSFKPVGSFSIPAVTNTSWSSHPVDRFILTKLEEKNLQPAATADKRKLIRRVTFALTGLPPTPSEIESFLKDARSDAYERVVDRLLGSAHFGEHWARHWMDLVRFAETHGSEGDPDIPEAWRYRDYLIRAFNTDLPYDQFIREQIAGDLLPCRRVNKENGFNESILGIAQFRLVEHGFQPVDSQDDQVKVIENQIDVLGKTFEGLTIACARCHDHKFDPISQRDFYALYGILASSRPAEVTIDTPERLRIHREELESIKVRIKNDLAEEWKKTAETLAIEMPRDTPGTQRGPDDELNEQIQEIEKRQGDLQRLTLERRFRHEGTNGPMPFAVWTFDGNANDLLGSMNGELVGAARIDKGRLVLDGKTAYVRTAQLPKRVTEKSLEVWVALENRDQGGGGAMTLQTESGGTFDSIVYGEREAGRWMAGSESFIRTRSVSGPVENAGAQQLAQMTIVYRNDNSITLYRDGKPYGAPYTPDSAAIRAYEPKSSRVLFGLRHTGASNGFLKGEIEEARLYDRALNSQEVAASFESGISRELPGDANILSPEEQKERETLQLKLASLRTELKTRFPEYGAKQRLRETLASVLTVAVKDKAHPLHPWALLHSKTDKDFFAGWTALTNSWNQESAERKKFNAGKFKAVWDLTAGDDAKWFKKGINPPELIAQPGEFSIEPTGEKIITGLYPKAMISHRLSQKHNGVLMSPRFKVESAYISVYAFGGKGARVRLVPDNYPIGTEGIFPQRDLSSDSSGWITLDTAYRKGSDAYLEFVPSEEDLARNRPPSGEGGRSYFGVQKVVFHEGSEGPREEFSGGLTLLECKTPQSAADLGTNYGKLLVSTIENWQSGKISDGERAFLDRFIRDGLLPNSTNQWPRLALLVAQYRTLEADIPNARRAPGVVETTAYNAPLFNRGDHRHPGEPVPRRFLEVLGSHEYKTALSGRLELAEDITNPSNPLTARVIVNRVWHELFGRGLVGTVDNFGRMGERPTHPELLDFLASAFIKPASNSSVIEPGFGWSIKSMIRLMVTSKTYQMASTPSERAIEIDPDNQLLSHMRVHRLEAESVRDSLLAISERIDPTMFGPGENALAAAPEQKRRSIYLTIRRNSLSPFLEVFDAPKPFTTLGRREATNVPAQSLALLNDPFVIEVSRVWAGSLIGEAQGEPARVNAMFERAFARPATVAELTASQTYLADLAREYHTPPDGLLTSEPVWRDFAQSLFNFKEFIYVQ